MLEQTRREIEAETRRVLDDILRDVAELTVLATERVTRKILSEARTSAASSRMRCPASTSRC